MKKDFLILALGFLLTFEVSGQNTLLLKNKGTGKKITINQKSYVTFQLNGIQKQYIDWKVERIMDSSLVLSTYSFCNDTTTYSFNEREIHQIPFSNFEYYRFQLNDGKKMAAGWGMFLGAFFAIGSPLAAYDSDKKEWSPETFYTTAAVGTALFTTSYIFFKRIIRKEREFKGSEWTMQKIHK